MTTPREETETDDRPRGRARRLFARVVGWLRDLHRGYARTGHLPYRKK